MTNTQKLTIGTRGSALALAQTTLVQREIQRRLPDVEVAVQTIRTLGDKDQTSPFSKLPDVGLFVKELEQALLAREIDLAVHSMKDLPIEIAAGLRIVALGPREDARDALLSRTRQVLVRLPAGAVIGTSSPRRRAQVLWMRPDVRVAEIRGNVDTRLRKLEEGRYDAIIAASAGLRRLNLADRITEVFSIEQFVPAPAQGALALEARADDPQTDAVMQALLDANVQAAVDAERAFLKQLGGGCQLPIGAHATIEGDRITLVGCVCATDGRRRFQKATAASVAEASALGGRLAAELLGEGAGDVLGK